MRFILTVVNTELTDNSVDKEFSAMEALLEYVKAEEFEWTSLCSCRSSSIV